MLTATHKIKFESGRKSKKLVRNSVEPLPLPQGRLPRITKMMALAIRLDHLIKSGQVKDQAELARVGHVSRARLTQIMNMLYLAPDIQDEILFLPSFDLSRGLRELDLRPIAAIIDWNKQKLMWRQISQMSADSL